MMQTGYSYTGQCNGGPTSSQLDLTQRYCVRLGLTHIATVQVGKDGICERTATGFLVKAKIALAS